MLSKKIKTEVSSSTESKKATIDNKIDPIISGFGVAVLEQLEGESQPRCMNTATSGIKWL